MAMTAAIGSPPRLRAARTHSSLMAPLPQGLLDPTAQEGPVFAYFRISMSGGRDGWPICAAQEAVGTGVNAHSLSCALPRSDSPNAVRAAESSLAASSRSCCCSCEYEPKVAE